MSIEAMKQMANYIDVLGGDSKKYRQAIAEAEKQKPVAWMDASETALSWENYLDGMKPLYTTPPAAQRQPLTDEEIDAGVAAWFATETVVGGRPFEKRMRAAIEAAHGIKETNT